MKRKTLLLLLLMSVLTVSAQKKPLDHSVYDSWQSVSNVQIAPDGRFTFYEVNPQEGDGAMFVYRNKDGKRIAIPRGYRARIAKDGKTATLLIKASFSKILKARKKKKKDDMPKDTLAVVSLDNLFVRKYGPVKGYKTGILSNRFLAYETVSKKKAKSKDKTLVIANTASGKCDTVKLVNDYAFAPDASRLLVFTATVKTKKTKKDSIPAAVILYNLSESIKTDTISKGKAWYGSPKFSVGGSHYVFLASTDSAKTGDKHCSVFYDDKEIIQQGYSKGLPAGWTVNQNSAPEFSRSGKRIILGVAPLLPPKDSTIYTSETAQLDIWNYKDFQIQPQQKVQLNKNRKYTYLSVINLDRDQHIIIPLATSRWDRVSLTNEGDGEWALSRDYTPYYISSQWDDQSYNDVSLVNTYNGKRKEVATKLNAIVSASPNGRYLLWYAFNDSAWYAYNIAKGETVCLSKKTGTAFYDEEDDHPNFPPPYDYDPKWTDNDKYVIIADRYDLWQFAADGSSLKNLTNGYGRRNRYQMRSIALEYNPINWSKYWREKGGIRNNSRLYMTVFDEVSKKNGLASVIVNAPKTLRVVEPDTISYASLYKSPASQLIAYKKGNFRNPYDLYLTKDWFKSCNRLTAINPQMKDYSWGTAHLVHWNAFDGTPLSGIVYLPENVDSTKKYPLISYFYERRSDGLYNYISPRPSRSTINLAFYASRGYVVFVPDIVYRVGHPGESAYNCIVSGVKAMCKQFPFIDSTRMALQGQSWGGYQTAYIVTRTNIFAAAGAGAPVSNMTSAYGGIRWASGVCRQMQYEHGQSRVGKDLWEKGGLDLYIENSPLFKADKVETPLLIMHNDNDGAVPWYQGIEYFMALRRLGKPVWLLQYNEESHNLVHRRNCKDLSIRLQQFFDHYLKGEAEPAWMKNGVPATRKGQYFGTELIK